MKIALIRASFFLCIFSPLFIGAAVKDGYFSDSNLLQCTCFVLLLAGIFGLITLEG